ncbi:Monooxygenase, FAD-binding [Ostreococcus tauri]|uniref:Monooxygenase, FAD-binding n=1 Tax=Ostreococcus tauri TaxID=70448 RepID=A0A090M7I7_OSTTA|nr:Monooxygenase, FAD-binding [Ostreococcus tauri]CEG01042.1 Monooxygenase, FAD-binding [Ostreococcus tauri]|eukprot:XP_003075065.2 Monooxygenase, FAD-binding [Ostreococcus tauri]
MHMPRTSQQLKTAPKSSLVRKHRWMVRASARCVSKSRKIAPRASKNREDEPRHLKLHIVVAGGGLGGLFLAICLTKKGFDVTVLERTQQYRAYGGPIQLASNGTGVLKAVSQRLYDIVRQNSRSFWETTSGIKDGSNGAWLFKFDAITEIPKKLQLPFAVCVDRSDLQSCLLNEISAINEDDSYGCTELRMGTKVQSYTQDKVSGKVRAQLVGAGYVEGDILVGADGIWSDVRAQMLCEPLRGRGSQSTASHTGFKLFSDLPIYETGDFFDIGYCAYIGPNHYFVTCPDRRGRIQWYAFIKGEPDGELVGSPKGFLLHQFRDWSSEVKSLISVSDDANITQRDLWDRPPCLKGWSDGNVVLLGDSCHATMPNIGQGCGLAFEDAFVLADILSNVQDLGEIERSLKTYCAKRLGRTAAIQGLGRMNSEAIKILTPLLPIKPVIDFVVSPFLPFIFELQFGYCYSFCPSKENLEDSLSNASRMRNRHELECKDTWRDMPSTMHKESEHSV